MYLELPQTPGKPFDIHTDMKSTLVAWAAPVFDGGTPICGYHVRYREHGSTDWTNFTTGFALGYKFLVTGLKKSCFYEIQIAAENKVGMGDWSESSDLIEAIRKIYNIFILMQTNYIKTYINR